MLHFLLGVLLLTSMSCTQSVKDFSATEKEYLNTLPLEQRAFMESCMKDTYTSTSLCIKYKNDAFAPKPTVITKTVNSSDSTTATIVKTAVGTAIGYGAVKFLTGKKK